MTEKALPQPCCQRKPAETWQLSGRSRLAAERDGKGSKSFGRRVLSRLLLAVGSIGMSRSPMALRY